MVTDEAYVALQAENAAERQHLTTALQRIHDFKAQKTPPPSFVKANTPAVSKRTLAMDVRGESEARRREEPTRVIEQALPTCSCGGADGATLVGCGAPRQPAQRETQAGGFPPGER